MDNKHCPECGKTLFGRVDKKFYCDVCRHAHNNRQRTLNGVYFNSVNSILRKNRKILADFKPTEPVKTIKQRLYEKGFNFSYMTSTSVNKKGVTTYYCYDYGYIISDKEIVYIMRKEDL